VYINVSIGTCMVGAQQESVNTFQSLHHQSKYNSHTIPMRHQQPQINKDGINLLQLCRCEVGPVQMHHLSMGNDCNGSMFGCSISSYGPLGLNRVCGRVNGRLRHPQWASAMHGIDGSFFLLLMMAVGGSCVSHQNAR
jgi:hypothetical protein